MWDVSYGGGHFVALEGGSGAYNSTDGRTWSGPFPAGGEFIAHNETGRAVMADHYGGGFAYSDDNGESWTDSGFSTGFGLWALTYGAGRFVAVGRSSSVHASSDGVNWSLAGSIPDGSPSCNDIAFGGGRFVVAGAGDHLGGSGIWYSDDGSTWHWATADRRLSRRGGFGGHSVAYRP